VLAGKDLSDDTLAPLSDAILGMVDSALVCLTDSTRLRDSIEFRVHAEQAYRAVGALGVSPPNVQVVMEALFRRSDALSKHPPRLTYK
jgi:hypothetical protein